MNFIWKKRLYLLLLCAVIMAVVRADKIHAATVYWNATKRTVELKEGVIEKEGDAYGYFNDTLSQTGWGVLEVRAGYGETPEADEKTLFLAGYLEGFLTAPQMFSHYANMYPQLIKHPKVLGPLKDFMSKQDSWTRKQVRLNKNSDPLWQHVGFIVAQMDGLQAGATCWANSRQREPLSMFAVQFLNAVGDLLDLIPALVSAKPFRIPGMGHCSALIKMLPGYENLLLGHSSWYTYAATLRIYKHWDFRLTEPHTATGKMSFSSYPGFLVSLDDFYLLGSGLLMTQTTNSIFNSSLFSMVTPHSLLAWQRVRLAHALAHTGEQWAHIFSKYNSGTYNSQYSVVDVSRVSLGNGIKDGALTVVEQIPGMVVHSDQTQALRQGYWPSYNVPFHPQIYNLSGYGEMRRRRGEDFSYDLCPRAKIFRRDQAAVKDLASMKHLMRYNNYKKDPYARGHPCKTICCRNDLRRKGPRPGGCYDTKVTDYHMAQQFVAEAVNGPTTQGSLPAFSWSRFSRTAHQGLPHTYNFTFVTMRPALFLP
ncbi:phospholipase B-like 1 [Megalops cyprinoides]|uniref:phospholipase B-like 1 n=1 Tax=Megalops cyprinoides TaxID=118141 RepID=UPI001864C16A|nr:phospholipase B-like 1 [Megalops cyprinoides]